MYEISAIFVCSLLSQAWQTYGAQWEEKLSQFLLPCSLVDKDLGKTGIGRWLLCKQIRQGTQWKFVANASQQCPQF